MPFIIVFGTSQTFGIMPFCTSMRKIRAFRALFGVDERGHFHVSVSYAHWWSVIILYWKNLCSQLLGIDQWNQPMQYQSLYAIEIAMAIKSKVEMPEIVIKSSNLLVYISNTSSHRTSYLDSPHPFNAHIITNCAISFN